MGWGDKEGRKLIEDKPRSGWPSLSSDEQYIV